MLKKFDKDVLIAGAISIFAFLLPSLHDFSEQVGAFIAPAVPWWIVYAVVHFTPIIPVGLVFFCYAISGLFLVIAHALHLDGK
jgi:hypothetical protein